MGAYALTPYLRGPTYRGLTNTHLLLFSRPTDYDISICCSFNHSSCIRTRRLTTRVASWSFNTTGLLPFYVTPIQYMITTSNNRVPSRNGSYLFLQLITGGYSNNTRAHIRNKYHLYSCLYLLQHQYVSVFVA